MKILVTGATGFIGEYVCEELQREGFDVLAFDRHNRGSLNSYETFYGDIRDPISVFEAFAHCNGFIHLAAVLGTQETIMNPLPAAQTNVIGGLNVLQAAAQYKTPGVYIGVGNHWMQNTYSISKTAVERFVHMYNKERGTSINIVRAMNAYGPRQVPTDPHGPAKVRKITPSFVCRALEGLPLSVYGSGNQVSDMVYVADVARCLVLALFAALDGNILPVIECGPDDHTTVREFAEKIIEMTDSNSQIILVPMRPGEEKESRVIADTATLKLIGFTSDQFTPLETGLRETIDYFRRYLQQYRV